MDSGNLVKSVNELDLTMSVLASAQYDAVGVGETDARVCRQAFFEEAAKKGLTILDASGQAKTAVPYSVKLVDGIKVGMFSFGARAASDAAADEYESRKTAYLAYKEARAASDILIVLDQARVVDKDWLERNGVRLGAPDIVVGGTTRMSLPKEEVVGKTHIVQTSMQGKLLGVVDVVMEQGKEPVFECRLIPLDEQVPADPAAEKLVKDFIAKTQGGSATHPGNVPNPTVASSSPDRPYYSSLSCKTCHQKEYDSWQTTRHAHAVETLVSKKRAEPGCLPCHSEMFKRLQRVNLPSQSGGVGGVECASCHMQSLPHGMERRGVTAKTKVSLDTCRVCHTRDRSPNFEESGYLAKVLHGPVEPEKPAAVVRTRPPAQATPPAPPSGGADGR